MLGSSAASAVTPAASATVSGSVNAGGHAVASATVSVYNADTNAKLGTTSTDANGKFTEAGITVPRVKVGVVKAGWATTYAFDKYTLASANVFSLATGQQLTLYKAITLYPEAVVDGSVMGIDNDPVWGWDAPLGGVTVSVLNASTDAVLGTATTDSLGKYSIGGLPRGDVKVRFSKAGWLTTYADGKYALATATVYHAQPLVHLGQLVIYGQPAVMGQVLGTFDPLEGATVTVYDANTGKALKSVTLGAGQYEYHIGGLPVGPIKVGATAPGWLPGFADFEPTLAAARVFTLEPGNTLVQAWSPTVSLYIDLVPEAFVSGTVNGVSYNPAARWNGPLGGVTVTVFDATTNQPLASGQTDAEGKYRIGGINYGATIKVRASKPGWTTTYAFDKFSLATANSFPIGYQTELTMPKAITMYATHAH